MIIKISVPSRFRLKKTATFRTILMQNQGEIHYIGGADVLPAPLTLEEETRTLACLGTEEEKEARSRLIEHNLRLVVYIAKKFDNTSVGVEDLISIGTIGLIKAINTFDPVSYTHLEVYKRQGLPLFPGKAHRHHRNQRKDHNDGTDRRDHEAFL